ncbi:MAG: pentapeptide repeat-containing protein [Fidelibacterota bacterium]|nr:MAG: pentapeptide repeat-containing protein [Candidatus Neomarinimicrobiota bacterium]
MSPAIPKVLDNEMYRLLREDKIDDFNAKRAAGEACDFRGADFRNVDLHGADVRNIDFSDCYFRQANLRGLDMSTCRLEGASIRDARISGTYFPKELTPEEIRLSHQFGTRMRYRNL